MKTIKNIMNVLCLLFIMVVYAFDHEIKEAVPECVYVAILTLYGVIALIVSLKIISKL